MEKAIRRQITIHFKKNKSGPKMELLLYLPANAKGPAPIFLNMSFLANNLGRGGPEREDRAAMGSGITDSGTSRGAASCRSRWRCRC